MEVRRHAPSNEFMTIRTSSDTTHCSRDNYLCDIDMCYDCVTYKQQLTR